MATTSPKFLCVALLDGGCVRLHADCDAATTVLEKGHIVRRLQVGGVCRALRDHKRR